MPVGDPETVVTQSIKRKGASSALGTPPPLVVANPSPAPHVQPGMRTTPTTVAALLTAAVLAGCTPQPAAAPLPAPTVTVERPAVTPTATPTPSPSTNVGVTQTTRDDEGFEARITLVRFRHPLKAIPGVARPGRQFVAAEVRMCVDAAPPTGAVTIAWTPWTLTMADETVVEAMTGYSAEWWDVPLYPQGRDVREGRCVRGWIPFSVPKGATPIMLVYGPEGGDTLEWRLK